VRVRQKIKNFVRMPVNIDEEARYAMAMSERADVFIVGGGPAGLVAGIAARQQGLAVIVADGADYPIDKPCGEGLIPEAQAALARLNIEIPASVGYRFRGIRFLQRENEVCAEYPRGGQGIGMRRTVLHELLVAKAEECGVEIMWKTPVAGIEKDGVRLKNGAVKARWIVGADGSGSRVRRWSGLEKTLSKHRRFANRRHYRVKPWTDYTEVYWGERAQGYVTPISNEEVCIVVTAETAKDANFSEALDSFPELNKRLENAKLGSRERGAITSMHSLQNVSRGNVALVGDASGSVDAITGEGLRLAFSQAVVLAECMKRRDLREYQFAHGQLGRRPTWMGKLLVSLGRNASLRRRAIKSLAANPKLFGEFLSIHGGHSTIPEMIATGARMSWEFLAP
jgi:menaquinone-9 beta-reductase